MANLFTLARRGTDIASAATITPPEDGDRFEVTGTTGITTINAGNRGTGARLYLVFTGVVTVTHATTTLELQGAVDFTSAAGDMLELERTSGGWIEIGRWKQAGGTGGLPLNLGAATELTIATGAIAATSSWHTVDTESDAAADDLTNITGGADGDVLVLRPENSARAVTIKHNSGNIMTSTAADIVMSFDEAYWGIFDGGNWLFKA